MFLAADINGKPVGWHSQKFKVLFCTLLALAIPAASFAQPWHDENSSALRNAVILTTSGTPNNRMTVTVCP